MTQLMKVEDLHVSDLNVRKKHTKEDIASMAHSIKQRGVINPLTVAMNGDGTFEVLAGHLRLEGARTAGIEQVPIIDMSALTEIEKIDVSLAENIERRNMTALQQLVAFDKLFKAGQSVEQIGERLGQVGSRSATDPRYRQPAGEDHRLGRRKCHRRSHAPGFGHCRSKGCHSIR